MKRFNMSIHRIWALMTPEERREQTKSYDGGDTIDVNEDNLSNLPYWFTHAWGWSVEFSR